MRSAPTHGNHNPALEKVSVCTMLLSVSLRRPSGWKLARTVPSGPGEPSSRVRSRTMVPSSLTQRPMLSHPRVAGSQSCSV